MTASPHRNAEHGAVTPSALQLTRAAIARWRGKPPSGALPRDLFRVSVQARHLASAQRGLAAWIAQGGFAQDEDIVVPALSAPRRRARADACID